MESFFIEGKRLSVEQIYFEGAYPILYSCSDGENLYLCVCCQSDIRGIKTLVIKVVSETVVKMLEGRITIREAFLGRGEKYIVLQNGKKTFVVKNNTQDWGLYNPHLPTEGEYLDPDIDEFSDEIQFLKSKYPQLPSYMTPSERQSY